MKTELGIDGKKLNLVRIYLDFIEKDDCIEITQVSKKLDGEVFLRRTMVAKKPYFKSLKFRINGSIMTTRNKIRNEGMRVTHIGLYVTHPEAIKVIKSRTLNTFLKDGVKVILIDKNNIEAEV